MVEVSGLLGLIGLALIIYALVKIVQSRASTLSKVIWVLIIVVFPFVGFILWFIFGPKG